MLLHGAEFILNGMELDWKRIVRDTVIIFVLIFIVGYVVGVIGRAVGLSEMMISAWISLSNLISASAGFAYSAYTVREKLWQHLIGVAVTIWFVSLINIPLGYQDLREWMFGLTGILVFMTIGGGIGFVLRKLRGKI